MSYPCGGRNGRTLPSSNRIAPPLTLCYQHRDPTPGRLLRKKATTSATTKPALTRGEVTRGLRAFVTAGGLWGAWGQTIGIGTAAFTGFALHLGADDSFIALMTSVAQLLVLSQLLSPLLSARVRNRKRLIVGAGCCEVFFRALPLAIPLLLAPHLHLGALVALVSLSLFFGYGISPFYGAWIASTVPEKTRARFTSRQTIISTIGAMVSGFLVGQFLDLFPEGGKQPGFIYVMAGGAVFGWLGYLALSRAPYPKHDASTGSSASLSALIQPFRDASFRRAVVFYGMWVFCLGLDGPFYSIFMLDRLRLSYTEISIYNALFMATSIAGYRTWSGLVDRFGSKAVLQILLVPASLLPLLWIFNRPDSHYLVPVAMVFSGILLSGITVSITPMVYGLLPDGDQKAFYLASWSVVGLVGALGPLVGSYLARVLRDVHTEIFDFPVGNLQLIFLIGVAARLAPIVALNFVRDAKSVPSSGLLSQMLRGNLLSYAYNTIVYGLATSADSRARAAYAMGRSGNPLAIEQLVQALVDASPKVRRSAARALGETGSASATGALVRELLNGESDIRSEAAEALGRLGHAEGIDPLIDALEDSDPRVRISAISGLAATRDEEVHEALFWHFSSGFDRLTFPTLVDALGERGDKRIVEPALKHLGDFHSAAVRMQLLNGVCRALGAGDQFYRLLSQDDTARVGAITSVIKRAASTLRGSHNLIPECRDALRQPCQDIVRAYEDDDVEATLEAIRQIVRLVRDGVSAQHGKAREVLSVYVAILAINTFLASQAREDLPVAQEIFLAVCLDRMARLVKAIKV